MAAWTRSSRWRALIVCIACQVSWALGWAQDLHSDAAHELAAVTLAVPHQLGQHFFPRVLVPQGGPGQMRAQARGGAAGAREASGPPAQLYAIPVSAMTWLAVWALLATVVALGWAISWRRTAQRLRASERSQRALAEDFGRIFESSLDMICVLDANLAIKRVNPAVEIFSGHKAAQLTGKSSMPFIAWEDRADATAVLEQVKAGLPVKAFECRIKCGSGATAYTVWSAVWSQQRQEMYCIGRDDTQRRRLVASLQRRGKQLQHANMELQTFARSASHDLRSPVAAIKGFVGKVARDCRGELAAAHIALLERSLAAADRMDALIEDLLRLAKVSEHSLERTRFDLGEMARHVAQELVQGQPGDASFEVLGQMQAIADRRLMRIVMDNLIGNALKFTSRTAAPRIVIGQESNGSDPVFFVQDNGAGFDMCYVHRLFSPFSRLHSQDEFPGTGIGLSIVHKIITRHGGRIWAESAPGLGAIFRFTLGEDPRVGASDSDFSGGAGHAAQPQERPAAAHAESQPA